MDGNGSWKACVKYVDDQFMAYFDGESGLNRKNIIDTRHSIYIRAVSSNYLLYTLLNWCKLKGDSMNLTVTSEVLGSLTLSFRILHRNLPKNRDFNPSFDV